MASTTTIISHFRYNSKYRRDIEGLRAFAVLAVIINHFSRTTLPSGYLGVDIFFVISGFVISSSLVDYRQDSLYEFLSTFYARRIRRLIPALLFCLTVSSLLVALLLTDTDLSLRTAAASVFGVSNMYLFRQSTDYFAASSEANIFLHTWSLGVEEQFYILFPAIFWITRQATGAARNIVIVVAAISLLSLCYFIHAYGKDTATAYFLMPARFWELGAGCALYFLLSDEHGYSGNNFSSISSSFYIAAIIVALFIPERYAVLSTLLVIALTIGLISSIRPGDFAYRLLCHPWMMFIGAISYSLYLWHWIVIASSRWTIGVDWWTTPFQFAIILLLATFSNHFIESPLRRKEWSPQPSRAIFYGLGAAACVMTFIVALDFPLKTPLSKVAGYINPPAYDNPEILVKHLPCHIPKKLDTAFDDCLKPSSSKNIYLIGDSHASNHYESLRKAVEPYEDWSIKYLIDWGFIFHLTGRDNCDFRSDCIADSFDKFLNFFDENLRPGDVVVFSFFRERVLRKGAAPRRADPELIMELKKNLELIKAIVVAHDSFMIFVDDIPRPCNSNVLFETEIIHRGNLDACAAPASESKADRRDLTDLYRSLLGERALYFDPHDFLCVNGLCGVALDDSRELIYGDASPHFLLSNAAILSGPWRDFLENMSPQGMGAFHRGPSGAAKSNSQR